MTTLLISYVTKGLFLLLLLLFSSFSILELKKKLYERFKFELKHFLMILIDRSIELNKEDNFIYHMYPMKANGDHVSTPIGLRGTSAVTRCDFPPIKSDSDVEL